MFLAITCINRSKEQKEERLRERKAGIIVVKAEVTMGEVGANSTTAKRTRFSLPFFFHASGHILHFWTIVPLNFSQMRIAHVKIGLAMLRAKRQNCFLNASLCLCGQFCLNFFTKFTSNLLCWLF
jgi:hypothetical protein